MSNSPTILPANSLTQITRSPPKFDIHPSLDASPNKSTIVEPNQQSNVVPDFDVKRVQNKRKVNREYTKFLEVEERNAINERKLPRLRRKRLEDMEFYENLELRDMDMTANDQTLQVKPVGKNEEVPEPPLSDETRYNYRLLDFSFNGNPDESKNGGLEQDKASLYQREKAQDQNPQEDEAAAEANADSDSGLSTLSLMPCNRYMLQRKKKPVAGQNHLNQIAKETIVPMPSRTDSKEVVKPNIHRTYERPVINKPSNLQLHLKNAPIQHPTRKPANRASSTVTLEEAISRYIRNNHLKVLLDDNPTPSTISSSNRQVSGTKSNNDTFFVTEVANRPKPIQRPSQPKLNLVNKAVERTSPQKAQLTARPRLNVSPVNRPERSPGNRPERSPPPLHTSGLKVIKTIHERVKTRVPRNLHEVTTVATQKKVQEAQKKRLELTPQGKPMPMRYNMVKSDYNRNTESSFSSQDSRGLSTGRAETKLRNNTGLTPDTRPTRKTSSPHKANTSRSGGSNSSSRSYGGLYTARSIANATPEGRIPSLRTYEPPQRLSKPKTRPLNGPKQNMYDGKRMQNPVKPLQKTGPKSNLPTNLLRNEGRTNLQLGKRSNSIDPRFRTIDSARSVVGQSGSGYSPNLRNVRTNQTTPLSSNLSTGNRKGFPGIESLERRRLEAKLALDEQTGVKLPSHRNTVSTILEDP